MDNNVLYITNRQDFRNWLVENANHESECLVSVKRGKPRDDGNLYYLDAVEEALCFGWIDSTQSKIDGIIMQRFSPRRNNSRWTELNKERVRRLEKLGLMTDQGRNVLPDMSFTIDSQIALDIDNAGISTQFYSFPPLYQRVRAYNLAFCKNVLKTPYPKTFAHFVEQTKQGKMYGEWNDYGRLLDY